MKFINNKKIQMRKSVIARTGKKGFVTSILLISLPMFVTCLMGFVALLFCIRNYDLSQKICLQEALKTQSQMQIQLEQLMKLNPVATQLRLSYQHVSYLLRIAMKIGEPFTISYLRTKKEILRQKRLVLDRTQKQILKQSQISVQKAFFSFKQQMKKFQARQIRKTHNKPRVLAVKARSKNDIAPRYYIPYDFSRRQTLSLYWRMPLYHFMPEWIKKIFFKSELSSYSCAATLKKKEINGRLTWLVLKKQREQSFNLYHNKRKEEVNV